MVNKKYAFLTAVLSWMMICTMPLQILAATPEFARSSEEWAKLQDDVLEYDEIPDLIHEYNATVKKNAVDMNEYRKDYGDSNDEWSDRYRELAEEIEDNLDYPDADDTDYASRMLTIVSQEMQIDNLRDQADEQVDDSLIQYTTYQQAEAALVSVAQNNLISYQKGLAEIETAKLQYDILQDTYRTEADRNTVGKATDMDVLTAEENLKSGQQAVETAEANTENTRQKLIVMLGWSNQDAPQIEKIPEIDQDKLASIDPSEDKKTAIANNYSLKIYQRKMENAVAEDTIENLRTSIEDGKENIGALLTAEYHNVQTANTAYQLALSQSAYAARQLQIAEHQYQQSKLSAAEYTRSQKTAQTAELAVKTCALNLFQALQDYEWAVNGLASVSQ